MINERFGRYRLLILFLLIYFFFKSPLLLVPKVTDWIPLMATIADAYLISFIIFLTIKNYEGIASSLKRFIGIIYNRNEKVKADLLKFITISILLTLLINVS